jgi:hypothetical protein
MKKSLLFIFLVFLSLLLQAQKDTNNITGTHSQTGRDFNPATIYVSIFPVPVRDNNFTIKTDRDVSFVKITNIIGQDIFRTQYNSNPQQLIRIALENPKRGMYMVTILFNDGKRVVKKIMIEQSE